jgi:hypothetical protein
MDQVAVTDQEPKWTEIGLEEPSINPGDTGGPFYSAPNAFEVAFQIGDYLKANVMR